MYHNVYAKQYFKVSTADCFNYRRASISTTSAKYVEDISKATQHKEAPIVDAEIVVSPEEYQKKTKLSGLVTIPVEVILTKKN